MGTTTVHDLGNCNLTVCGLLISGGGGQGGFVKITPPTVHEHKDGVHGDAVSYRTGNRTAIVEITLLSTAPANADLTSLVNTDLESADGAGIGDFLLEDLNDGFTCRGKFRLDGYPEHSRTAEPADVVWKGRVFDPRIDYDGQRG